MSIKEQIVEKVRKCGYDMFTACEEADRIISEFLKSGQKQATYGIMGAGGKCADTITLQRK